MNHAVVIRLKYPPDSDQFRWRLSYFEAMCLPSLLRQTDQNFQIMVLCDPRHSEQIKALSDKIITIHSPVPVQSDPNYNRKSGESNSVEPFNIDLEYTTQTRCDSDDMLAPGFVEFVNKNIPTGRMQLFSFLPIRFNTNNLRLYKVHPKKPWKSQFLSLFNPKRDLFIYSHGHGKMAQEVKNRGGKVRVIDHGYCYYSLHHDNASGRMLETDELI